MMIFIKIFTYLFLFSSILFCQDWDSNFKKYELTIGIGIAYSPEKDIFNIPNDSKVSPDMAISIAFAQNINKQTCIGGHIYGYTEMTPKYSLILDDGTISTTKFELNTFNIGGHWRWLFSTGTIQPYSKLILNYANGELSSKKAGDLEYHGISLAVDLGSRVFISEHFTIALELLGSFGFAAWKEKPFLNSKNKDFNPSMVAILINVSYLFSEF